MGIPRKPLLELTDLVARPGRDVLTYLREHAGGMSLGLYNSGRTALYHGLGTHFGETSGTVLLPSYICSAAIPPFHESTLNVEFYDVERTTGPDLGDLESKVTDETVAVVTVDYFGFPARRFEDVQRLCDDHGLVHVEDNAHSVLSRSGSALLGTRADWGMTSLHKLLPVPDGGVLFTPGTAPAGPTRRPDVSEVTFVARNVVKRVDSLLFDGSVVQRINERAAASRDGYELAVDGMSPLTEHLLGTIEPESVAERRRRNYGAVADVVVDAPGVEALFPELPEGVCPLMFPLLVERPERVRRRLQAANVPVRPWPYLPEAVQGEDAFATANYLSGHVLTIPVHQGLDRDELVAKVGRLGAAVP